VATRNALLRAAGELFPARGFDGVSIEDIARRARINKALISYHFGGKRGLYAAVLESVFAEMAGRLRAIEAAAKDTREALGGFLAAFERLRRERPGFPALFLREVLSAGIEPVVIPHLGAIIGVTRRIVERGVREGLFRRVDPVAVHLALVGSLIFYFATEPARREAAARQGLRVAFPSPAAFLRHLEELTLRGLAHAPARRKGARA
jgi:TetR/AcrR family transcriptional regulator